MNLNALDYGWAASPPRSQRVPEKGEGPLGARGDTPRRAALEKWTPGRRTQHDRAFHPSPRRLCYNIGGTVTIDSEGEKRRLEEFLQQRENEFHLRLESCTHDRPAVSLRGEPSGGLFAIHEKTQYDKYAESLELVIQRLNDRPRFSRDSFSKFMQHRRPFNPHPCDWPALWRCMAARMRTWSRARPVFGIFQQPWTRLEFVWNEEACMPPQNAKAARRDPRMPRIGAFEVVMAVHRRSEDYWYEFVLWSKLDAQKFPSIDRLEYWLEDVLGNAMGRLRQVILLQACLRRKLTGERRLDRIRIEVACKKIQGYFRALCVRLKLLFQKLRAALRRAVVQQRRKARVDLTPRLDLRRRVCTSDRD